MARPQTRHDTTRLGMYVRSVAPSRPGLGQPGRWRCRTASAPSSCTRRWRQPPATPTTTRHRGTPFMLFVRGAPSTSPFQRTHHTTPEGTLRISSYKNRLAHVVVSQMLAATSSVRLDASVAPRCVLPPPSPPVVFPPVRHHVVSTGECLLQQYANFVFPRAFRIRCTPHANLPALIEAPRPFDVT